MAQRSVGTSATAVAAIVIGGTLAWSGLRGWRISAVARDFLGGADPFKDPRLEKTKLSVSPGGLMTDLLHAVAPGIFKLQGSTGYQSTDSAEPSGPLPPSTHPQENFRYAQLLAGQFGWNNQAELDAWYRLGMKESGWRADAQNPHSTAYGIGQFLDSTWAAFGPKTSDPYKQVLYMAQYIKRRYGSPSNALAFHLQHNWY